MKPSKSGPSGATDKTAEREQKFEDEGGGQPQGVSEDSSSQQDEPHSMGSEGWPHAEPGQRKTARRYRKAEREPQDLVTHKGPRPKPFKRAQEKSGGQHAFVRHVHGVRYQVKDVARSVSFYTTHLGFALEHQQLPAFASLSLGDVQILLSGPGASGSRPMPNGQPQEPGGWNRVVLQVHDLPKFIDTLKTAGLHFRNAMETGPGGRQIQIEDPDGNPIELFEPAR